MRLRETGLDEAAIKRVIDPIESFHLQLQEGSGALGLWGSGALGLLGLSPQPVRRATDEPQEAQRHEPRQPRACAARCLILST